MYDKEMQHSDEPVRRIPKVVVADQDDRLTTRHIHTLALVQQFAEENKHLKAKVTSLEAQALEVEGLRAVAQSSQEKIQEIQEKYLARTDQINCSLADKHRLELMQKVEEKIDAEKKWTIERKQLLDNIEKLKKENAGLRGQLGGAEGYRKEMQDLHDTIRRMQEEVQSLHEENKTLQQAKVNQMGELQRLNDIHEQDRGLVEEVRELTQANKELQYRLQRLQREQDAMASSEHEEAMIVLRNKLTKLHKEKLAWTEKEKEYERITEDLRDEVAKLRRALADSEKMRSSMQKDYNQLLQEFADVKSRSDEDKEKKTFKDFVQLKREMSTLKQENEELRSKLKNKAQRNNSLPMLKGPGSSRPSSASSRADGFNSRASSKDSVSHPALTYTTK